MTPVGGRRLWTAAVVSTTRGSDGSLSSTVATRLSRPAQRRDRREMGMASDRWSRSTRRKRALGEREIAAASAAAAPRRGLHRGALRASSRWRSLRRLCKRRHPDQALARSRGDEGQGPKAGQAGHVRLAGSPRAGTGARKQRLRVIIQASGGIERRGCGVLQTAAPTAARSRSGWRSSTASRSSSRPSGSCGSRRSRVS